ncbi:MAG: prephenate dehydrogenase/arogenate dehydrogenase family protein [Aigarchaeota archaeon]|nr:prephenate dehydrogenase/arogenate dehydrogenase family protein [Aigarchaeota archaeon]MDW8093246.1 prephenate dehydrogenase/arogenate dehydrogenase family protein [Nitrososphaerota archaeon]
MDLLIIGCGRMGGWFARHLKALGHHVTLYDKNVRKAKALSERISVSYTRDPAEERPAGVVIAVPVSGYRDVFKEISEWNFRPRWVLEVSSVKSPVMGLIRRARRKGLNVIMIHPLFGPSTRDLRETVTAHVGPRSRGYERRLIRSLLPGTKIVEVDPLLHDEAMCYGLLLPHILGLAYALTLRDSPRVTRRLMTNSMRHAINLSLISVSESPAFYDPHVFFRSSCKRVYRNFLRNLTSLTVLITRGDVEKSLAVARRGLVR